ncbi:MAG: O-antigen polymerase [Erysipelotrichaceae bacterium]
MKQPSIRDYIWCSIFILILLCTTIYVNVPNPFSINSVAKVSLSELLLLFLSFYSFILILKKKRYKDKEFLIFLLFIISFLIITATRIYVNNSLSLSINITETITFVFFFSYLVKFNVLKKSVILISIISALSFTNISSVIYILFYNISFRSLPVMGNVNIYISFVLICIPFLIYEYQNHKNRVTKIVVYANLFMCLFLFPLTGSRVSTVFLLFLLISVYILIYKKINFLIMKKVLIILFCVIFSLSYYYKTNIDIKNDIDRTISLFVVQKTDDSKENNTSTDKDNVNEEKLNTNASDNIDMNEPIQEDNKIKDNNEIGMVEYTPNLRKDLIVHAVQLLKSNPLLGTGRPTVYVNQIAEFPIHNYLLEVFLNYGLLVGVLYFIVALIPLYTIIKNLKKRIAIRKNMIFLVGYLIVLFYSMFEPILSSKIVVLLPLWSYMVYLDEEEKGMKNTNEK